MKSSRYTQAYATMKGVASAQNMSLAIGASFKVWTTVAFMSLPSANVFQVCYFAELGWGKITLSQLYFESYYVALPTIWLFPVGSLEFFFLIYIIKIKKGLADRVL